MRDVLRRAADRLAGRPGRRNLAAVPPRATPSVANKEQIAALIRRDYPFMSDDCIREVLDQM
jgi:hypothetical protein